MKTKKLARLRIRLLVFGIILTTVMFNAGSFISLMVEQEGILKGGYRIAAGILLLISAFGGLMIVASDILLKKLKKSTVPPILFGCLTPAHLSIILSLHLTIIYISLYWFFSVSNDRISFLLFFAGCGVLVSICFALIRKSVVIRERRMGMMAQRDSSAVKDGNSKTVIQENPGDERLDNSAVKNGDSKQVIQENTQGAAAPKNDQIQICPVCKIPKPVFGSGMCLDCSKESDKQIRQFRRRLQEIKREKGYEYLDKHVLGMDYFQSLFSCKRNDWGHMKLRYPDKMSYGINLLTGISLEMRNAQLTIAGESRKSVTAYVRSYADMVVQSSQSSDSAYGLLYGINESNWVNKLSSVVEKEASKTIQKVLDDPSGLPPSNDSVPSSVKEIRLPAKIYDHLHLVALKQVDADHITAKRMTVNELIDRIAPFGGWIQGGGVLFCEAEKDLLESAVPNGGSQRISLSAVCMETYALKVGENWYLLKQFAESSTGFVGIVRADGFSTHPNLKKDGDTNDLWGNDYAEYHSETPPEDGAVLCLRIELGDLIVEDNLVTLSNEPTPSKLDAPQRNTAILPALAVDKNDPVNTAPQKVIPDVNTPVRLTASGLRLRIEKFGLNEDVLSHLLIRDSEISADLLMSGGSPFMRCDGADKWSGATSIDSMRGPASFSGLSFEEALKKVTGAVEYMLKHLESDVRYGESGADKKMEIQSENSSESLAPKRTFVCPQCKKELPIKYLYKNGMCTYCCEHPAPKPKEKPRLRNIGGVRPQPSESTIRDPYAYERKHVWAKQIELIYIPDMSVPCEPVDGASQEEVRRYYTVSDETIYIDSRDGHLISASVDVPAFNACGASRSDMPCEYEYMHDKVKKYINESRVKFSVKDPAVLLELNEYNWEDWLLKYKYDCIGTKKDQLGTKGSYATSAPKRSESRQPETNTRISSTDDRKLERLFEWEDRSKDIYEATGICFSYDLVSREPYSHSFHYVDAGCGSIGGNCYSTDTCTTWDSLLKNVKDAQNNEKISCSWDMKIWEQVCRDYAEHPEMKCESLDELMKLLKERRSRD